MNAPESFEVTVLPEGTQKVSIAYDERVPHAAVFTFQLEDHTIGNLLRMFAYSVFMFFLCYRIHFSSLRLSFLFRKLLEYPQITFVGYQIPHPLKNECIVRVQTDGSISPYDILLKAFAELGALTQTLIADFDRAFPP
jgi:DNA-directed RNA polymerase II subunit RPB11